MDMEVFADTDVMENTPKESYESTENSQDYQQENPDQQTDPNQAEVHNAMPSEQEGHSGDNDEPSVNEHVETEEDMEGVALVSAAHKKQTRGYKCKYCPFSTLNLNDFKEHVDSSHPNVILNPLYLCTVCNFNTNKFDSLTEHNESQHAGETNFKFKRLKINNQTILEQTIEGKDSSSECEQGPSNGCSASPTCVSATVKTPESIQSLYEGSQLKNQLDRLIQKEQITAVNINGTVIIPEPTILRGFSHVTPMLQRPPNFNSVPKIAVPLNTTKYNPSLDDNLTLITSFNKFPYPTHAELSWLTAASKHPEEQIKVWFTTQRLKQGITWSPEEVEEARKKMFNGSIPPAHHTFTVLPTSPTSQASATVSQQPVLHTTLRHPSHIRRAVTTGLTVFTTTSSTNGVASCSSLPQKRTHLTTVFGPESKRPVMAVAPHSGDPKDKVLMAPPPPPPPQKDRLPMAPPPVPMEIKRPVAVPLVTTEMKRPSAAMPLMLPPSSSSQSSSSLSKGKILSILGIPKTKPVGSLASIVFPESLTTPMIAPPPLSAPPFKNSLLIPLSSAIVSKERNSNTPANPAADLKLPNSVPLIAPQIKRPTIIQSIRAPAKAPSQIPDFSLDSKKLKEQQGVEMKASYSRGDVILNPMVEANGTSGQDCRWPHDQTSVVNNINNNGIMHLDGGSPPSTKQDIQQKSSVLTQFPLLDRMKGKNAEQLKVLEEYFLRNSFPTQSDVENLAVSTCLSHQEICSWFVERRALRDNLEQALLNSMGTKKMGTGGTTAINKKALHLQHQTLQMNGIHKPSAGMGNLKIPLPHSQTLPVIAPGTIAPTTANPNSCSVPLDSRSLALLKDDFAQTQWPSPEEFCQLDCRTGVAHTDLTCWFNSSQLQSCSMELPELFPDSVLNAGQGPPVGSSEKTIPTIIPLCQEGSLTNNGNGTKLLEVDLGRLMEERANSLRSQHHNELQERFADR